MDLGVTIGKFNPYHRGHDLLVRRAKASVEHLVVLCCARPDQTIPGAVRAGWIRDLHPDVEVLEVPDDLPEAPEPWARRTLEVLDGRRPDVVFTSEAYGDAYAAAMGARHVLVDQARQEVPISGTALRADLAGGWQHLTPPAKAHLARRVVVTGAESTGTTTLARALAAHHRTAWVPEYGRTYWEGRTVAEPWESGELLHIARSQLALEDALARQANRLLVCDTDAATTQLWHRWLVGAESPAIAGLAAARSHDLHLLTMLDSPFVQDGTRDAERREVMHRWFLEQAEGDPERWLLLEGTPQQRLQAAVEAVDGILAFPPLR